MSIYRQYEDPHDVEKMLENAKARYEQAKQENPEDDDRLIDLCLEIESLKDRVRFAWEDQEYDEQYAEE